MINFYKKYIFLFYLLLITTVISIIIAVGYVYSNVNEKNATANWSLFNDERKNLEKILSKQKEEFSKESNRLRRSYEMITNYTDQIKYAEKELGKDFAIIECDENKLVLQNKDFNLAKRHDSDLIDFKINSRVGINDLILKDIRHKGIKSYGLFEISKSDSIIQLKLYNRGNDSFLNINLIGEFQSKSGMCEANILILLAPYKSINNDEVQKLQTPNNIKKEIIISESEFNEMQKIEWKYETTAIEAINSIPRLSTELITLSKKLSKVSDEIKYNSAEIMALSRSINYAKSMLLDNINTQLCFEENFHLRNEDFYYEDLFKGESIYLGVGINNAKNNLSLLNLKFKELKHAGIARLDSDSRGYSIRLRKKFGTVKAVELIGRFEQKDGEQCIANIRLTFLDSKIQVWNKKRIDYFDKFESISILGKIGNDTEEFQLPYGSAFYKDALFITDCVNAKIQVFDKSGRFLYSFGERGTHSGQIYTTPADVQVHEGSVYIAEGSNHRIEQFSLAGDFEKSWGTYGDAIEKPTSQLGKFNSPFGLDFVDDMMIVSEHINSRVQALDTVSGKTKWLSVNSEGDEFDWLEPYYLKVDHERELIYVVARVRNWIGVLNFEGEKQYTFGNGVLNYPHEIDIGPDGKIYIADSKNYRLVVYDSPDSNDYEVIQFSPNFGYMKTVSVDYDGSLALGFNDGEVAYVLLLSTKEASQKKPGQEIVEAQKKAMEKNKIISEVTLDETVMMRTERLYTQNCAGCHENGSFGAPTRGDLESWAKFPQDRVILLSLAFSGNGAMMPKGGCNECTAEDLKELIKYITPMDWLTGKSN